MKAKAVFLDRDGVLNRSVVREGKPVPPASAQETIITKDAAVSLRRLKQNGFTLIGVTNQPDVARGSATRESVEEIHRLLAGALPVDEFFVCYHDDSDKCTCRKPQPGLLLHAAQKYNIDLEQSFLIGDRWRDIGAGIAAGCKTILIDHAYKEEHQTPKPDACVENLAEAVDWILDQERPL